MAHIPPFKPYNHSNTIIKTAVMLAVINCKIETALNDFFPVKMDSISTISPINGTAKRMAKNSDPKDSPKNNWDVIHSCCQNSKSAIKIEAPKKRLTMEFNSDFKDNASFVAAASAIKPFLVPSDEKELSTSKRLRKFAISANPEAPTKTAIAFCETSPTSSRTTPAVPV